MVNDERRLFVLLISLELLTVFFYDTSTKTTEEDRKLQQYEFKVSKKLKVHSSCAKGVTSLFVQY